MIDAKMLWASCKKNNNGPSVFWTPSAWYAQNLGWNPPILSDFKKERIKKGEYYGIEVINNGGLFLKKSLALVLGK